MRTNSSRYTVTYYNDSNEEARAISERLITKSQPYITHVVNSNESFSTLAGKYLNNEKLYWYIADQNPQIKFPDLIPIGTLVRIPLA
jgi:hypothetical protein